MPNVDFDKERLRVAFDRHRREGHVSLDAYVKSKRVALGEQIATRKIVYLDKRYWIILRDVKLGRRTDAESARVSAALRQRVSRGEVVCPISESVFVELLKQKDLTTRNATAALIDELSMGVAIAPEQERIGTELAHFFYSQGGRASVHPIRWLVWSKLSYVLGIVHPSNSTFSAEEELVVQKAFFDTMWELPLVEVIGSLGDAEPPEAKFDELAAKLNAGNVEHANEIRNFKDAYAHEIAGCLSLCVTTAREILEGMFERATGTPPQSTPAARVAHERQLFSFFVEGFKGAEFRKLLPTLHIHALCHAAVRWNKTRRLEGNDFFDFHHAAAAIPYGDAFLTEKALRTLLLSNHLEIGKDFACTIISSELEAASYLESM